MKRIYFVTALILVLGPFICTSCEKWDILYDCETNEVPGALFPGSPEGIFLYENDGRFTLLNRYILGMNPMDMSRTKVIDGFFGPAKPVIESSDTYSLDIEFAGVDYSLKKGKLKFTSKAIPVTVRFHHFIIGTFGSDTTEMEGKMTISGTMDLDGDRYVLSQYQKENSDITLYLKLKNGQRLRFHFNTLEDPLFIVDYELDRPEPDKI